MSLLIQLKLIIFSFFFGIYLSIMLKINYKYIYKTKILYRILVNTAFTLFNTLLYFFILLKINQGILHYYSLICIVLGFIVEKIVSKKRI